MPCALSPTKQQQKGATFFGNLIALNILFYHDKFNKSLVHVYVAYFPRDNSNRGEID